MDRQLRLACVLFIFISGACSRSKDPPPAAAAGQAAPPADSTSAPRNFEAEPKAAAALAVASPVAETAEQSAAITPPANDRANPLRRELSSLSPPETDNPLRRFRSQPPFSARDDLARAEPPPSPALAMAAPREEPRPDGGGGAGIGPPRAMAEESMSGFAGAEPPESAPPTADYDLVQVFYGTDRQFVDDVGGGWKQLCRCFWATAASALVTIGLGFIATTRRSLPPALLAFCGIGVSLGLAYQDTTRALGELRRAGKEGPSFTSERSPEGRVERGVCLVTIPHSHRVGEVESPSVLRLDVLEDASRHIVLRKTERIADARFYELLRQRVQQSPARSLFVFVHGFNVSFEVAARRTAQIHYDLKFSGAPIFFSWPAHDKFVLTYAADENNVAWSVPHLKQFLLEIVKESDARSINLIAHSMGNRAVATALREIDLELQGEQRLFNQVVLAAPDIDAEEFRQQIAPAMQRTAQRLTLYASSRDDALLASQFIHRGPRAGDAGEGLVVVDGIDTIDVSAIDTSPWGHTYYGSNDPVLQDLDAILSRAAPPGERQWLSPAQRAGLTYWIFQPTRIAGSVESTTR